MKEKKYYELYCRIKRQILNGEYKAGEKLPSKRVMSDMSSYSLITVTKAYGMLEDEGYIYTKERSGYFVCRTDFVSKEELNESAVPFSRLPEEQSNKDTSELEYSVWFKTVRKVISEKGDLLFRKTSAKGCACLRNAIADYLYRYRGMIADPERIIIGSGSEQLYESAVKLLGRDKTYGIEDPSCEQIRAVYDGMGIKIKKLTMGNDGIESKYLAKGSFDVLHVTPFHSYPSGVSTSISKRYEYLNWAKSNDNCIIEDDFDSEFFIPGHPIESLYSLDRENRVIYINTFSKSLSPAIRIGYMILPPHLVPEFDKKLGMFSCSVPVIDQYVLAEFISSGSFERHLNRMRRKMNRKA